MNPLKKTDWNQFTLRMFLALCVLVSAMIGAHIVSYRRNKASVLSLRSLTFLGGAVVMNDPNELIHIAEFVDRKDTEDTDSMDCDHMNGIVGMRFAEFHRAASVDEIAKDVENLPHLEYLQFADGLLSSRQVSELTARVHPVLVIVEPIPESPFMGTQEEL